MVFSRATHEMNQTEIDLIFEALEVATEKQRERFVFEFELQDPSSPPSKPQYGVLTLNRSIILADTKDESHDVQLV